ncbi:MAG: caspase family protein [Thiobacillus sp.]|nr:hypothetical protein [Gammaproteobacteria bacterium]MDO9009248.1 caspase family protein [Thiobacillus sp.]MDP1925860.1 caspase family protein [Thiobacillus sp.]
MSEARDRIFISIGVSKPRGGLDELPGAITAVERMAAWAESQGYTTLVLHDADLPEITIDLLRDRITAAIQNVTNQTELKRLVIFFAGHGAALAIGDQYWILTNWQARPTEAIKVSSLQRMLEYYGPKQVSVIGDACQEFSYKFIDLLGSPVLDKPDEDQHPYELDQFFAVDVGKQAFMIKANGDKKDFCLFTEVLLDALEGDAQETCFEEIGGDKVVTSQSLARYLDNNVAREAGRYGVRMIPRPKPGFYTDRVYLTMPISSGEKLLPSIFKAPIDKGLIDLGAFREDAVERGQRAGSSKAAEPRSRSVIKANLVKTKFSRSALDAQAEALDKAREASRQAFVDEVNNATVRDHFETGCGICVSGADVAEVEASFGEVSRVDEQPNWFRIKLESVAADSLGWSDTLVTLTDGRIVSVCVVNGFVAALHISDAVSVSLFHRPLGDSEYQGKHAIDLLAQAHAGLLNRKAIINTAVMLRNGKHRIITLGCIAAQFYDAIRDVDSLRSMAAFYAINRQPIPLDIILYGGGKFSEYGGRLYADIPAVAARQPRTSEEGKQPFTYSETPGFERHPIAGRIPWMRQAWGAVATADCDESGAAWRRQALKAMKYLAPGAFTIALSSGREAFFELAGITVNRGEPETLLTM